MLAYACPMAPAVWSAVLQTECAPLSLLLRFLALALIVNMSDGSLASRQFYPDSSTIARLVLSARNTAACCCCNINLLTIRYASPTQSPCAECIHLCEIDANLAVDGNPMPDESK